jgi:peptidyl-prolyl cis-trans isomerase-like 1
MAPGALASGGVVFETNLGALCVELYWDEAPRACANLSGLAQRGYYDGTLFHRVVKGFMVQGGDPSGTGRGGESLWGGTFEDELTPALKHTGAGVLSMANSGRDRNGSQFFLTLQPCPWLDGKHTVFGRVAGGMRAVQRIGSVPTDKGDRPTQPIKVVRAYPYEGEAPDMAALAQAAMTTALAPRP